MSQPINRIVPDAHVILKTDALHDKPDYAILVTRIFSAWARVELELSILLVRIPARYLAEFDFRHTNRTALGVNDADRATELAKGIVGKRLTCRRPNQKTFRFKARRFLRWKRRRPNSSQNS
jgi:hypothetical protein